MSSVLHYMPLQLNILPPKSIKSRSKLYTAFIFKTTLPIMSNLLSFFPNSPPSQPSLAYGYIWQTVKGPASFRDPLQHSSSTPPVSTVVNFSVTVKWKLNSTARQFQRGL